MNTIILEQIPNFEQVSPNGLAIRVAKEDIKVFLKRLGELEWRWTTGRKAEEFNPFSGREIAHQWIYLNGEKNAFTPYVLTCSNFHDDNDIRSQYNLQCVPNESILTPRNNDGRIECFWCNIATQKRGGGLYDVCPKCRK